MAVITPPVLTLPGLSPDRSDRATFVARSIARDDFIKNTQIPQLTLALKNVADNATDAATTSAASAVSAGAALVSKNAAADSASSASTNAATAVAGGAAATAARTAIDNKYRGALAADPANRTDGTANQSGEYYFNSIIGLVKTFNGATWQASDINTANLAAATGAGLVGYARASGGTATTVENELRTILQYGSNTIAGVDALTGTNNSGFNVAYGSGAARYLSLTPAQPLRTAVGNTIYGAGALGAVGASCDYVVAVGYLSMASNTSGYCNVGVGLRTLTTNTTGQYNTAIGTDALLSNTTASENTAVGAKTLLLNTTGALNTAVGSSALYHNTTGNENTSVGALASLNSTIGTSNTNVGFRSLELNDVWSRNTAVGWWALRSVKSGNNTAIGAESLTNVDTGTSNTAIGNSSLRGVTGSFNVGLGSECLFSGGGNNNVAVGHQSLFTTNASNNVAVGHFAGRANTTGSQNTFVGRSAGLANTTGSLNTAIGDGALSDNVTFTICTGVGYNTQVTGSNQVQLGDSVTTTYAYGAVQNRSDSRDKADVSNTSLGLDFVMGLQAKEGRWDYRDDYPDRLSDGSKKRSRKHQWFIAQEVQSLCKDLNVEFGGLQDHSINGGMNVMSLGYDEFIPPIVKALQEIKDIQDAIVRRLDAIERSLDRPNR